MNYLQAIHLPDRQKVRNHEIKKCYFKIIKEIAELSTSFKSENLRTRIEIDHKQNQNAQSEIYEVLTDYIYLCLNADKQGHFSIAYALNDCASVYLGQALYTQVIRILYKLTASSNANVNIEDCLQVFPYYSEVFDDARNIVRNKEYNYYKQIIENKGL
ncbi:hypothetical protein [Rubrolithibacter danxiaensis]|uniref:hypothetical protein n=1 Tax=Rubrolithibacter danxiaensis TaxID=3390805 RepID=UPI003BF8DFB1